ncbi:MAG: hypothetical protein GW875_05305 [Deltaproteobacteria bacterium]|nr:hypothetical protein [Deltaproteobacteria bacterium]NCP02497.1 hypothetical protein [Deltaproteobacteria bacterium]
MCNILAGSRLYCRWLLIALVLCSLTACSERTAFESLYQMRYQQCLKESLHPATDCPDSPGYDEYQREYQRPGKPKASD